MHSIHADMLARVTLLTDACILSRTQVPTKTTRKAVKAAMVEVLRFGFVMSMD